MCYVCDRVPGLFLLGDCPTYIGGETRRLSKDRYRVQAEEGAHILVGEQDNQLCAMMLN